MKQSARLEESVHNLIPFPLLQTDQSTPTAAPANFRVDNVGEQSAELSWHAPPCEGTNGDITEYEASAIPLSPLLKFNFSYSIPVRDCRRRPPLRPDSAPH
jgi:hypothetical protein